MIEPNQDGITHINIYSRGNTDLGRMLSNFYQFPFRTPDGTFTSVEGYWHWLSIEDCKEKERLRELSGFAAKKYGREILTYRSRRFDDDFEHKILVAIWKKFKRHSNLILPQYYNLPFEHYYNFNGKVQDVKSKYLWMIDGIDKMRTALISVNNNEVKQNQS